MDIKVQLTTSPKQKPDDANLGFGRVFTDHMFTMDWDKEHGWHDAQIVPFGPISLSPACNVFHYSQETFEGLKAYRTADGSIQLFRPEENFKRLNNSNTRLAMPTLDVDFCIEALKKLIEIDQDWVPHSEGHSLYIRPFCIATEPNLGAHNTTMVKFLIILSPVGAYYASGLNPVNIYVEPRYVRAVRGGTGFAKTGGNYAASMLAQEEAAAQGFSQVLWLDGVEQKYIEEVGAMNVFFVLGDEVVTPELRGSILPGITRKSVLQLAAQLGYEVEEKRIAIEDVFEDIKAGRCTEAFGTGTAAVISPVGELCWKDEKVTLGDGSIGPVAQKLYDTLTGIQYGRLPDENGWIVKL